jgi:hypothetical protein
VCCAQAGEWPVLAGALLQAGALWEAAAAATMAQPSDRASAASSFFTPADELWRWCSQTAKSPLLGIQTVLPQVPPDPVLRQRLCASKQGQEAHMLGLVLMRRRRRWRCC